MKIMAAIVITLPQSRRLLLVNLILGVKHLATQVTLGPADKSYNSVPFTHSAQKTDASVNRKMSEL
uniref:Uncharacterized protein n=1 Tax=Anguilla anguilla TaxID=7936 RepID=A0A0E9UW57_ANGAN